MVLIHSYFEATIDLFLLWCITSHTKKLQTDDETALWNSPFRCQCNKYYSWLLLTVSYVIFAMLNGSTCTLIFWWCNSHTQKAGLIYHCWINTGPKSLRCDSVSGDMDGERIRAVCSAFPFIKGSGIFIQ